MVEPDLSRIDIVLLQVWKRLLMEAAAVGTLKIGEFYNREGRIFGPQERTVSDIEIDRSGLDLGLGTR